jgi:CheY-like chemotaxis protein
MEIGVLERIQHALATWVVPGSLFPEEESGMKTGSLLVVDDDPLNREIILEYLEEGNFQLTACADGAEAWERLSAGEAYDAVVLDRMMPKMSGMELLVRMKRDPRLCWIPVIMQTASATRSEIAEGIRLGALYYLTKPFEQEALLAIVFASLEVASHRTELVRRITAHVGEDDPPEPGSYSFSNLEEAWDLAASLSRVTADPTSAGMGLMALMENAIEHGILGITCEEKVRLLGMGQFRDEVNRRMALPENSRRRVTVDYFCQGANAVFRLSDAGPGFDWKPYLELDPRRAHAPCGRGIAQARTQAFESLEYQGNGNSVQATIKANPQCCTA